MKLSMPVYIIISPVRNEENYIEKTLLSVTSQTVLPKKWLIVDDGSTDRTAEIAEDYSVRYDFIELIRRPQSPDEIAVKDRIARAAPPRTFNYGLEHLKNEHFDFVVKLDGDLSFGSDYFERLFKEFEGNPRLGIASGLSSFPRGSDLWTPFVPDEHVLGCTKVYRRECFMDIGGVVEVLGWDTIDEIKAQMHSWETRHFKDIKLIHWRLMGSANGFARGKMRHGFTNYYLGYHPVYMLARVARRMFDRPYIISGALLAVGYLRGYLGHAEQFPDDRFRAYLRETQVHQLKRLAHKITLSRYSPTER
ncbi:MAG: glycosyltransferase family 2 protein [Actinobacteria bacterium]|nr:glycosyltransferase family 2 protein [Actinomycetota bacterium]